MKTRSVLLPLLTIALLLLAGCQGKELSVALQTYNETMRQVIAARGAGQISDKTQVEVIAPARDAAKAILDEAVDAYVAGTPFDFRAALRRAYAAMAPLLRQRTVLEATNGK